MTGSDTSSNALFGALQVQTATKAGLDPLLMAARTAPAACSARWSARRTSRSRRRRSAWPGREGDIFRKVIGWSLLLLALMCLIVVLQSTPVLDWMVP